MWERQKDENYEACPLHCYPNSRHREILKPDEPVDQTCLVLQVYRPQVVELGLLQRVCCLSPVYQFCGQHQVCTGDENTADTDSIQ